MPQVTPKRSIMKGAGKGTCVITIDGRRLKKRGYLLRRHFFDSIDTERRVVKEGQRNVRDSDANGCGEENGESLLLFPLLLLTSFILFHTSVTQLPRLLPSCRLHRLQLSQTLAFLFSLSFNCIYAELQHKPPIHSLFQPIDLTRIYPRFPPYTPYKYPPSRIYKLFVNVTNAQCCRLWEKEGQKRR
jgi:hypothetical protein